MTKRIIDHDPITGSYSEFVYDEGTDEYIINDVQDVTAIIEQNKKDFNTSAERRFFGQDLRRIASLSNEKVIELHKAGLLRKENEKQFNRWLNDPENRYWRVSDETV